MYSMYNRTPQTVSPSGEKLVTEYEMTIDEMGHKSLTAKAAKRDIYEAIQENLEDSKIENIIRRATAGDESILHIHEGQFLDLRGAPTSLAEAQAAIVAAENDWLTLPVEVRAKFDHSFQKYINEYGTEQWAKVFEDYNVSKGAPSKETLKLREEEAAKREQEHGN